MKSRRNGSEADNLVAELVANAGALRQETSRLYKDVDRLHGKVRRVHRVADRLHRKIEGTHARIRTYRSQQRIRSHKSRG